MKNLDMAWVRDAKTEDQKKDFEQYLRNNTRLFDKLNAIMDEWEDALDKQERSKDQYDVTNWQALQAHRNGNVEIIQKLRDLISFYK